jgi:hypothetical protein
MAYWHALCTGLVLASEMNVMHSSSLQLLCSILDESHALEQERQSSVTVSICFAEMTLWLSGICSPFNAVTGGRGALAAESSPCTGHREMGVAPLSS